MKERLDYLMTAFDFHMHPRGDPIGAWIAALKDVGYVYYPVEADDRLPISRAAEVALTSWQGGNMYKIKRSNKEIDGVLNQACMNINVGTTKFRSMTFEEGLREMFDWLTTNAPEASPME